jgi:hypothetical protein
MVHEPPPEGEDEVAAASAEPAAEPSVERDGSATGADSALAMGPGD